MTRLVPLHKELSTPASDVFTTKKRQTFATSPRAPYNFLVNQRPIDRFALARVLESGFRQSQLFARRAWRTQTHQLPSRCLHPQPTTRLPHKIPISDRRSILCCSKRAMSQSKYRHPPNLVQASSATQFAWQRSSTNPSRYNQNPRTPRTCPTRTLIQLADGDTEPCRIAPSLRRGHHIPSPLTSRPRRYSTRYCHGRRQ